MQEFYYINNDIFSVLKNGTFLKFLHVYMNAKMLIDLCDKQNRDLQLKHFINTFKSIKTTSSSDGTRIVDASTYAKIRNRAIKIFFPNVKRKRNIKCKEYLYIGMKKNDLKDV